MQFIDHLLGVFSDLIPEGDNATEFVIDGDIQTGFPLINQLIPFFKYRRIDMHAAFPHEPQASHQGFLAFDIRLYPTAHHIFGILAILQRNTTVCGVSNHRFGNGMGHLHFGGGGIA